MNTHITLHPDETIAPQNTPDASIGFLCFTLGSEEFGVDLNLINQIIQLPPVTPVPRTRSYFKGVISVRGEIVTVVDFRQLLGLEPAQITRTTRVLMIEHAGEKFGLMIDAVTLVRHIPVSMFEQNPAIEDTPATSKVMGIIRPEKDTQVTIIALKDIINEAVE